MNSAQYMGHILGKESLIEVESILNENKLIGEYTLKIWDSLGLGWKSYDF